MPPLTILVIFFQIIAILEAFKINYQLKFESNLKKENTGKVKLKKLLSFPTFSQS